MMSAEFPPAEAAPPGAVDVRALPGQGVLAVTGADAESFLQGQLTNDLRLLVPESMLVAAYQSPQGRVLTVLRVVRNDVGFLLLLPRGLAGATAARLARYTLRAKVRVEDASDRYAASGSLGTPFATQCAAFGATSVAGARHARAGATELIDRGHGRTLILTGGPPGPGAAPADGLAWMLAGIRAGDPEVWPSATESFTAHMLNLDLIGAVSFTKGCYAGQEIVARTQHLGRVKRRMFRYVASGPAAAGAAFAPLTPLYFGTAKVGEIVTGVRAGEELECLAVVSLEARELTLTGESGVEWTAAPLPYAVPG